MPIKCYHCLQLLEPGQNIYQYGVHESCYLKWFGLSRPEEFGSIARRSNASKEPNLAQGFDSWNTSFFHGTFKKYSATLANESYIMKVREDHAPELPEVEYVCNQIGRALGLPVPDFYFISFLDLPTFVTKNFIRKAGSVANLTHIYHYLSNQRFDCESIMSAIQRETKRFVDIETFVRVCLVDTLVGNHDRHGRNLGLVSTARSTTLSPIYDNISALGLESGKILAADWNPKGKIATKVEENPSASHYVDEFRRLGFEGTVLAFFSKISLPNILDIVNKSFVSDSMKDALKRLISKRYEEMKVAIHQRS